jgi:glyoxylase-like metal-dependent hydrolase (beta-lactamase superfamily II)
MRVRPCGEHAFQLTRFPAVFPMNCYLVLDEDGATLVDSTSASPAADVAQLCAERGVTLRRIALTHAHGDHVGGVAGVLAAFDGLQTAIGARDAKLLAGDRTPEPGEPQRDAAGYFVRVDWKPDRLLQPGDRVGSLEVVSAPGHTPGQVAFLDVRDRTLLVGDAYQTRGGIAVSGVLRPLFPFPALATWDKPTALASARRLLELAPARLGTGHGDVLEAPEAAMRKAIAAAERAFPKT